MRNLIVRTQLMFSQPSAIAGSIGQMNAKERNLIKVLFLSLLGAMAIASGMAEAFTAPTTGSMGYDVYTAVNSMLTGPIGFVGGVILIVWGASQVMKQWLITVLCVIAGTVIIKANTIVTSLGALVS